MNTLFADPSGSGEWKEDLHGSSLAETVETTCAILRKWQNSRACRHQIKSKGRVRNNKVKAKDF